MSAAAAAVERLRAALASVLAREELTQERATEAFEALLEPEVPVSLRAAFLAALRTRGETPRELAGAARALLLHARRVALPRDEPLVDTCGTGGDGRGSFNVSSAAALLLAALGVRVAKHGNRSVSSRCGSSDLFQALGVPLPSTPDEARAQLARDGFVYLHAPHFHPALAQLAALRRELGVRTAFNLLGPLVNPARPTHQLVGAATGESARALAETLACTGGVRALVVHGAGGFDEATPTGPVLAFEVADGALLERVLEPRDFGLARCRPEDLAGGDAPENAARLRVLFQGERGPLRDALCLNAALLWLLLGRAGEPRAALAQVARALDDGRAAALLVRLTRAETNA